MDLVFIIVLLLCNAYANRSTHDGLRCMFSRGLDLNGWHSVAEDIAKGTVNSSADFRPEAPSSLACVSPQAHCVAFWVVRSDYHELLLQGCWDISSDICSSRTFCVGGDQVFRQSHDGIRSYMCCCRAINCNSLDRLSVSELRSRPLPDVSSTFSIGSFIVVSTVVLLTVVGIVGSTTVIYALKAQRAKIKVGDLRVTMSDSGSDKDELASTSSVISSSKFDEFITQGSFSRVYKSNLVFESFGSMHCSHELHHLMTPSPFFGSSALHASGNSHLNIASERNNIIVLGLHRSSLNSLLQTHTVSWMQFFACAISITDALAFLHSHHYGLSKFPIAHCNISSSNILVKDWQKGEFWLTDFGPSESFPCVRASDIKVEEMGTVRYMAPELLQGSINLFDPMISLPQVDTYACGIVLWEILWRCIDLWKSAGMSTPEYQFPFADLVSPCPSVREMINIVVHQGLRPQIPEPLILSPTQIAVETDLMHDVWLFISDLWESEPEGRATAACTADRFRETLRNTIERNLRN